MAGDNGGVHPGDDQQRLIGGRYRLSVQLGSGAMGTVWSGYDEVLRRRVAVKELKVPPGVPQREAMAMRERMLREARALGGLSHPNVITVYDVVDVGGEPMVVLEMVPSRNLATLISEQGVLSTAQSAVVGFATAAALRAAHRAGITHRDVKPGNVLVAHDGQVKLTDFGIARNVADAPMTTAGLVLGSPAYIAPEVAAGQPVTPAADLWGLGRDAVRRGRGTPAVRRARRPRLDDHRGRRRRGPAAERERPRHRRDRRAHGQGACEADAAGRGAAAAAPADRRPRRPALPRLAGRADDGRHVPGAQGSRGGPGGSGPASSGGSGPAGRRSADARHPGAASDVGRTACRTPPLAAAPPMPAAPLAASPGPLPEALRAPHRPRTGPRAAVLRRTRCRPRSGRPRRGRPRRAGRATAFLVAAGAAVASPASLGGWAATRALSGQSPLTTVTVATDAVTLRARTDDLGFTAQVPEAWAERRDDRSVSFVSPDGSEELTVAAGHVRGGGPGGAHRRRPRYGRPAARPAADPGGGATQSSTAPPTTACTGPAGCASCRSPTASSPCGSPRRAAVPRVCPHSCSTSSRTRSARRAERGRCGHATPSPGARRPGRSAHR